jgi:methylated-DNA-[protein]-cysteine S-methyltransferase
MNVTTKRRWWDEVRIPVSDRKIEMLLVSDGEQLTGAYFGPSRPALVDDWTHDPKPLAAATAQLQAYAAGELTEFDLPLEPEGTSFQKDVWSALTRIPYGTTTTYGRVAAEVGRPSGSRAVGAAVGRNPIGVIIPCHRVIGADGSLTGFGGGLDNKVALLRLEGVAAF